MVADSPARVWGQAHDEVGTKESGDKQINIDTQFELLHFHCVYSEHLPPSRCFRFVRARNYASITLEIFAVRLL